MGESIKIADKRPYAKSKIPVSQTKSPQIKRAGYSQFSSPVHHFLFLQRNLGNRTVQRPMKSGAMQAKLRIGMPGDIYEQEADRVAEQVMRMPETEVFKDARVSTRDRNIAIQRRCPNVRVS